MDYEKLQQNLNLSAYRSICRLCLETSGQMEDLFFNDEDDRLLDKIFECTSVTMIPANGIISSICKRCLLRLADLHNFREQCIRCEEIFQSKVDQMENETIEVVPDIFNISSDDEYGESFVISDANEISVKDEQDDNWHGMDIEDAMTFNGGAFLIKTSSSPPESDNNSLLDEGSETNQKNYTLTPPTDINLKALVVYIKDKKHWKCPHCEKYFSQSGNLKAHINTHTGYKPYTCNLCNRSFAQKSNLNYHMKASHDPLRPFKCNACDRAFASMDQMVIHLKSKHSLPETPPRPLPAKKHSCPYCGKGFSQSFNLRLHVNTHTGERPYKCDLCPKTFTQRSNLNVHFNKSHKDKQQNI